MPTAPHPVSRLADLAGAARRPHRAQGLVADTRGAAAVEFALVLPVLLLLLAGLVDLSRLIALQLEVRAAAQAGADYAQRLGWNEAGVTAAVTDATAQAVLATPAPTLTVACVSAGALVPATTSACAAGGKPGRFVTVGAAAAFAPVFPGPHRLALPAQVVSRAQVRVE
ncbi:TadE/TadG family type IV pilus assembly protein [Phenylobacterium sp.]|uniref:TadE/TadG family type IV pilus assembly protein n=1 Tax=Phenylobacterium sp. TaxID=1871053 RepID=UPI0035B1F600